MAIKILSNSTINRIAAGEVIERPASVVKELLENAIDAGATKISISLQGSGKSKIVVGDNGDGIPKEELSIAIQRHATSKLDEDDLLNITNFGFRGEALPSIAAISKFKITSKYKDANHAYSLSIIGGDIKEIEISNINKGTIVEVRDLFFATPARLKFLRSDRTELGAIISLVKKIALSHPEIGFTLSHNDKELLKLMVIEDNIEEKRKRRITDILGQDFINNASHMSIVTEGVELFGYTSLQAQNRASAEDQYLFINNRPVKDKILNIALKIAYQDFLARNHNPISVIFLNIDPKLVDVNVHPAKTEVRFYNPNEIRSIISSAVKNALADTSHKVSDVVAKDALNYMISSAAEQKSPDKSFQSPNLQQNFNYYPSTNKTDKKTSLSESSAQGNERFAMPSNIAPDITKNISDGKTPKPKQGLLFDSELHAKSFKKEEIAQKQDNECKKEAIQEHKKYPLGAAKTQLHKTYVISQTDDSIIIIDQHAAYERLGYEKIKQQIAQNSLIKQRLLIPEIVEFVDKARVDALIEHKQQLSSLGLIYDNISENSVIISEIPSLIGDINVKQLVKDIADHLVHEGADIALSELIEHVTATYACHYAIQAVRQLNIEEMNSFLRQVEATSFSGECNHGRPTYVELKSKDIEKLFGRR